MKKLLVFILAAFLGTVSLMSQNIHGSERRFNDKVGVYVYKEDTVLIISKERVFFEDRHYKVEAIFTSFKQIDILLLNEKDESVGMLSLYGRWNTRYLIMSDDEDNARMYHTDLNQIQQELMK